jgi:probable phosphoglycerate mutase
VTATAEAIDLAVVAAQAADDKLARDIVAIDVSEHLVLTDIFVIVTAQNERQAKAIVDSVEEAMFGLKVKPLRREGLTEARWILMDFGDVVVHVQLAEERVFYDLERLCQGGAARDSRRASRRSGRGPRAGAGALTARRPRSAGRTVVWLRHGRTDWNLQGRFQGQTDIPLDDVGRAQADQAARVLVGLDPDAVIVSDLARARDTAEPLARLTGLTPHPDPRLRETYAGTWEGRTHDEIRAVDGDAIDRWATGEDLRPGGGETRSEVAERVGAAVDDALSALTPSGLLVVVTHGGAARAGMCAHLGLPVEHWAALGVLANCSWSVLVQAAAPAGSWRWRMAEYNAGSLPAAAIGDDR